MQQPEDCNVQSPSESGLGTTLHSQADSEWTTYDQQQQGLPVPGRMLSELPMFQLLNTEIFS